MWESSGDKEEVYCFLLTHSSGHWSSSVAHSRQQIWGLSSNGIWRRGEHRPVAAKRARATVAYFMVVMRIDRKGLYSKACVFVWF